MASINQVKIDSTSYDIYGKTNYGVCDTGPAIVTKSVTVSNENFALVEGAKVAVKFTYANTANSPYLKVNNTTAKKMLLRGADLSSTKSWTSGMIVEFIYNGTYWHVVSAIQDNDTTYSDFVESGSTAKAGLVPKPPTTAGETKFLREDATWAVPPNTTYTFNGAVSTIKDSNLTANRALISNASGKVAVSTVTSTELGYLDGVTSTVQTQLNAKMEKNNPVGTGSFSMNRKADTTIGNYSHAEGYENEARGRNSHAEGRGTTASGAGSHAEGADTTASGDNSHAEGDDTTASGTGSHTEGYGTTASGAGSHAEGYETVASNNGSHAEGRGTTASGGYQHVQGKYNISDVTSAHIVGNGDSTSSLSNAHTVDWDGNGWFAGDVYVGSTSGTNKDDGSKKLITASNIKAGANTSVSSDTSGNVTINSVNTTYTFATGDSNGQIKITPVGGTAQNVSVKGLGSAAYTNSSDYKPTQTAVSSPSASGNTTSFIDTISQNANGVITATKKTIPTASGTVAGITVVYPAASCTTYSSDSGTVTPLAVQKGAKMFSITRPPKKDTAQSVTANAIARWENTDGDLYNSKIIIEDVTNSRDSSLKAQVIAIPAEGGKKMVYGYCTDQIDGTSFIGGIFDQSATEYPYNQGLAIGGTSGNLLWKGTKVATTSDITATNFSGTLTIAKGGTGVTSHADTTYTTARYRASSLHSSETNPTINGVIAWTYE